MRAQTINKAEDEARRFLEKLQELKARVGEDHSALGFGCRETGAVKRASLDLSQALTDMRQGR
jgi:hypothetical protein